MRFCKKVENDLESIQPAAEVSNFSSSSELKLLGITEDRDYPFSAKQLYWKYQRCRRKCRFISFSLYIVCFYLLFYLQLKEKLLWKPLGSWRRSACSSILLANVSCLMVWSLFSFFQWTLWTGVRVAVYSFFFLSLFFQGNGYSCCMSVMYRCFTF